ETAAPRNGGLHAGFPQGFLTTRRMMPHPSRSCLLSRFLADECNPPNCQRAPTRRHHSYAAASPLIHRVPPIPSAGASCLLASHPGRVRLTSSVQEVAIILVDQMAKVNNPRNFFQRL